MIRSNNIVCKRLWLKTQVATLALTSVLAFSPVFNIAQATLPDHQAMIPASFADLVEKVRPAVVSILTKAVRPQFRHELPFDEFFRRFFEERQSFQKNSAKQVRKGLGSGFIIDSQGLIVTNHHVIEGADDITVKMNDGNEYSATVLGYDAKTDLALLKIDANKPLPSIAFGDSDKARVGDWVIAVGNPFGFGDTFTAGIISARGRDIQSGPYDDFIQIDAPINKGNSGGPLLNLDGKVVGINTAIYSPNGGNVGIGFAVPSSMASSVIDQLRQHGNVERGWLGVQIQTVSKDIAESLGMSRALGALVSKILPNTPAEKAGIQVGDVIIEVNDNIVKNGKTLSRIIANTQAGQSVKLGIWRHGAKKTITVRLGRMANPLKQKGQGGKLGLTLSEMTAQIRRQYQLSDDAEGVIIVDVKENSPAAETGLQAGDVIVMVNQEKVYTPLELLEKVKQATEAKRKTVLLLINRQGKQQFVMVKIA